MPHPVTPAPRLSLADGAMIPQLGFGLYKAVSYTHLTLPTNSRV